MKKLLGILVLGLLLSGCYTATVEETVGGQFQRLNKGMSKFQVRDIFHSVIPADDPFAGGGSNCRLEYIRDKKLEILSSASRNYHFVFENVTIPKVGCHHQKTIGNGIFYSAHNTLAAAQNAVSSYKSTAKETKPKKKKPKQIFDDNKIVAAGSGTGFFVSKTGHIITNHHVIDQCKAVKVNFKGSEVEAKVLAIDKTNDLAILKANINPSKVFTISNEDVSLLQDIIVAGFPLGKNVSSAIKTHKGSVTALAGFGDNYSNFQTDETINQGNSGGPVMDQKGNIVGVAVALMSVEAGQNIFFAVKSSTLKTFAGSNALSFLAPNNRPMSNKDLGQLITEGTVFLECWMTVAKIKQIIAQDENRKAFYSKFK